MKKQITFKKTVLTCMLLAFASFAFAQTTFTIPVKTSDYTGSADHDTTISIHVGDIVKMINYGTANVFGYSDNLILTPVLTSSIAINGTIHQWTVSSTSYTHLDVVQSPSATYGRRVYVDVSAGVDENNPMSKVSVYPCPASDKITVDFPNYNNTESTIFIYDLKGSVVLQQSAEVAKTEINIKHLLNGIYFIKLSNKDGVIVKKFIKE